VRGDHDTYVSYIDRCKKVGRLGPKEVKLDSKNAYGEFILADKQGLDVEAVGSFVSIRANTAVFSGRYYYEVMLKTDGLMQIGWSTIQTPFNSQRGVGDDLTSYAYDGFRIKKWNRDNLAYGEAWSVGDIIGTLIDFDRKVIQFWRNHKSLGKAFTGIKTGPNCVYFPAISL
jgi:Kip1 ubiquitination-promoting complex protein 1